MNKRGAYFFVIDALIASSIIFMSLIIIFTTYNIQPESSPALRILGEYTNFMINTRVRDFQGVYVQSLLDDGNITRRDNTLLEQLTEFYYINKSKTKDTTTIMQNFIAEVSQGIIPEQRSFSVYMNSSLLYSNANNPIEESNLVVTSKKISFKRINQTYIYGPVIFEIKLWV